MRKIVQISTLLLFTITLLTGCGKTKAVAPEYKAAKGEGEPISVRWDFGQEVIHSYSFDQETTQNAASFAGGQVSKTQTKGQCTITCEGKSKADLKITNLKAESSVRGDPGSKSKQKLPDVAIDGLKEDGTFSGIEAESDFLMTTVFKLPEEPIAVGGTEVVDLEIPFHVNGSPGKLKGKKATTFVGYYEIYGVNCVHLEMKYEYYAFEGEDGEESGSDRVSLKGSSDVYFDPEARRIHRSVAECDVKFDLGVASIDQEVKVTLHRI